MDYRCVKKDQQTFMEVSLSDYSLISYPLLNKGLAFSQQERLDFNLLGLIPPHTSTIEEQRARVYEEFRRQNNDLDKYLFLRSRQDSNEVLFYNLLLEHIEEMLPIVYTPTVGLGCQQFSHIYRHPRGVFVPYPHRDKIDEILSKTRFDNVKVIVVSDGERILGLGDQGAGGMGIPIGKLVLYSACAGIFPGSTLPILLDTGTNNQELINDPLYIGWRHERIRGAEYDQFIESFVNAVKKRFPHVLLQWEDFAQQNAYPILEKYKTDLCTFNDDIQGTAAVAVGTLLAAVNATKIPLKDHRIVVVGGGSAGVGISSLLMKVIETEGLSEEEAKQKIFIIDRPGLLMEGMDVLPFQRTFLHSKNSVANWNLENPNKITLRDVIFNLHPTVLVGVSGQAHIFTEELITEMAKHAPQPVIFPLSNPTDKAEAIPEDIMKWTQSRALIGTGSPFNKIERAGKLMRVDQVNNSYIFPGLGLGLISVQAKYAIQEMFIAAAKALANCSPAKNNPNENLLPPMNEIRDVSLRIATAVAKEALKAGIANIQVEETELENYIHEKMWNPVYLPYRRIK